MPDADFHAWQRRLMDALHALSSTAIFRTTPPTLDARIPYRLGLSPEEAAGAYLGTNRELFSLLVEEQKKRGW